jgi:DNA-binding NarL/FixJ family response regulator
VTSGNALRQILVVDDDDAVAAQLVALLTGDGAEVRRVATGDEGLASALADPPQLVLLEVNLPGMCGYELLRRLRETLGDGLPIVFMSGERIEAFDRVAGMLLGADDYIVKPFSPDELLARIRRLLRSSRPAPKRAAALTSREHEVLDLLAAGFSHKEIAHSLVLAPKTCAKHIERILEKLEVHSRAQAVAVAYRDELITIRR